MFQHSKTGDTSFQHSEIDATMFQTSEMDVVQFFNPPQLFVPPLLKGSHHTFYPGGLKLKYADYGFLYTVCRV